ncbi:MAG: hypothetical protein KC589_07050 [Nanoarchaeota archaeon]|nr:hypothetical protein [Nanoarchaeota archaeon]
MQKMKKLSKFEKQKRQKLKIKKGKLEEKITIYRKLFKLGILEPTQKNVEDWLNYYQNKNKAKNLEEAKNNAIQKAELLESLGLNKRSEKIKKELNKKPKNLPNDYLYNLIYKAQQEIEERTKFETFGHSKNNFIPLIKYGIYNGEYETYSAIFSFCQKFESEFKTKYGFGNEYVTDDAELLWKRIEILRDGYCMGVDINYDINLKRNKENYKIALNRLKQYVNKRQLKK